MLTGVLAAVGLPGDSCTDFRCRKSLNLRWSRLTVDGDFRVLFLFHVPGSVGWIFSQGFELLSISGLQKQFGLVSPSSKFLECLQEKADVVTYHFLHSAAVPGMMMRWRDVSPGTSRDTLDYLVREKDIV